MKTGWQAGPQWSQPFPAGLFGALALHISPVPLNLMGLRLYRLERKERKKAEKEVFFFFFFSFFLFFSFLFRSELGSNDFETAHRTHARQAGG
jgi:hypothetical protein